MADDADKPLVVDFDAEGRQYRATERASHTGADIMDISFGETIATFYWRRVLLDRHGSEWMMDDTIDGFRSFADGVTRRRAIVAADMNKAEEAQKRASAGQTPTP